MDNGERVFYWMALGLAVFIAVVYGMRLRKAHLSYTSPSIVTPRLASLMPAITIADNIKEIEWISTDRAVTQKSNNSVWPSLNPPRIVDQGEWGSCTAFSVRYAYLLWLGKRGKSLIEPSTAHWYAISRQQLNLMPLSDTGSTTGAVINVLRTVGSFTDAQWPYIAPNIYILPPKSLGDPQIEEGLNAPCAYKASGSFPGFKQLPYVSSLGNIPKWQNQAELFVSEIDSGRAVLVSFNVYSNLGISSLTTGIWPSPKGSLKGGHAICLVGYVRGASPADSVFTFFNSWGLYSGFYTSTGNGTITQGIPGLFSIPFSYVANTVYAADFWSI